MNNDIDIQTLVKELFEFQAEMSIDIRDLLRVSKEKNEEELYYYIIDNISMYGKRMNQLLKRNNIIVES